MSSPRKRPKSLASTNEHSADGMKTAQSRPSEPLLDKGDTTLSLILPSQVAINAKLSFTPASVVAHNSQTSTDKLPHCLASTLKPKSSRKSGADSTSSGRKCWPYWDKFCQEMSAWLSLPTKTDWQDSALTCFDGSANRTGVNSWFSTRQVLVQNEKWLRTCDMRSCD